MSDNKIYPGGGAVVCAKKTPLVDLLRGIPKSDRAIVDHDEFSTSYIPIGAMCHDAADEIERLRKERDDFHMDYRMKCDAETKKLHEQLAALKARDADWQSAASEAATTAQGVIDELREQLAAMDTVLDDANKTLLALRAELAAVTRERDECLQTIARLDEANLCMHTELAAMKEQTK